MLLVDSGGQYDIGTTDVTRTMHMGEPTAWQRECFTRVLKGHIGLATAVFPEGTPGPALDAFARAALWQVGLDYLHGNSTPNHRSNPNPSPNPNFSPNPNPHPHPNPNPNPNPN